MHVKFPQRGEFLPELRRRVQAYLDERHASGHDDIRTYIKVALILALFGVSYWQLVFVANTLGSALLWGFLLGHAIVLIGFNIMHDGAHQAMSKYRWINSAAARSLDFVGASVDLWRVKHNVLHHTYTNIAGIDQDLDSAERMRFSPGHEHHAHHRFQHWYALPMYCLLSLNWVTADFLEFFRRKIGNHALPKHKPQEIALFLGFKTLYFGYALVVPLLLHTWWHVALGFVLVHFVAGFFLAIVFQLAHVVEATAFPIPDPVTGNADDEWALHQLKTTANFAVNNPFVTWYAGGLNFQVEHHLFPKVTHVHYPEINKILKQTCAEFGYPYLEYPTLRSAVASHVRLLKTLGEPMHMAEIA